MDKPPKTIADLFENMPFRRFPAKQILLYRGDEATRVYYIISGYVRMYTITNKGNERTLVILGPGESLPLIQTKTAQHFYDAFTDVEAAYGSYDEVVQRFLADESYMEAVRDSGVKLMQRMMAQMEILAADTAAERLEEMLKFLGEYYGERRNNYYRLSFKITHQELANPVNVTRETVSQNLIRLEQKKLVKTDKDGHYLVKTTDQRVAKAEPALKSGLAARQ